MSTPTTLLVEHKRRWLAYVEHDKKQERAAKAAGMSGNTFRSWLRSFRGEWSEFAVDVLALPGHGDPKPTAKFWTWLGKKIDANSIKYPEEATDKDAIAETRKEQERKRLKRERDEAIAIAIKAQDYRASVFGLTEERLEPVSFQPMKSTLHSSAETVIVNLSDWQWGEVVDIAAMDGINSFNPEIAARRAERCFQAILDLMTKHWSGPPPARLILILGGDMVSGDIHLELTRSNALSAIPAVRQCVTYLRAGLQMLLANLECPIDLISLPGNHGRTTFKNESKLMAETSYDNLVADFLEMEFRSEPRVTFYTPVSGDAIFSVYGWRFLATHGHNIGARGGMGFVGPSAPASRGFKRLIADYAARGIHIDFILIGHFHTAMMLEEGFVNGTLVGPSEYSRDGRFRPRPATQLYLAIHPRRGVSQLRFINVGDPTEGTLYERPEPPADLQRPKYRVPAVTTSHASGRVPDQFNREARLGKFKS